MRFICCSVSLMIISGCGSDAVPEQAGAPAGIALSIANPSAGSRVESELSEEQEQAVEDLISRARQAVATGQAPVAVEALSQAIGINPSDARLLRMRADVYALSGELANAKADFSTAILANPENAELRNMRGYFLMTNGVIDEALTDFGRAIEIDPSLAAAWNNRGLIHLQRGAYADAKAEFEAAVRHDPEYADGWNNLGFAKLKLEQLPEALADIERSLRVNPEYITAWNNRGLIHMRQKDFEAACTAFTKTIELAPLDARWYTHRMAALRELGRFDEAARDRRKLTWVAELTEATRHLSRDASDASRWIARGELYAAGEMFEEAVQDLGRALQLEPTNVHALNARALVFTQSGQLQKALDDCDESIVLEKTQQALSIRGDVWLSMESFDHAIADFEDAMRCDSTVAEAYRERAAQRKTAGETDLAAADLQAAQRIEDALAGRLVDESKSPDEFPVEE